MGVEQRKKGENEQFTYPMSFRNALRLSSMSTLQNRGLKACTLVMEWSKAKIILRKSILKAERWKRNEPIRNLDFLEFFKGLWCQEGVHLLCSMLVIIWGCIGRGHVEASSQQKRLEKKSSAHSPVRYPNDIREIQHQFSRVQVHRERGTGTVWMTVKGWLLYLCLQSMFVPVLKCKDVH